MHMLKVDKTMWGKTDSLYELYGFHASDETEYYKVYVYEQGYFHNAEIIIKNGCPDDEKNAIKDDLTKSGYSVSIKKEATYSKLSEDLFLGFFKAKQAKERVKKDYEEYKENQTKRLGGMRYTYISSDYTLEGKLQESHDLLEKICDLLNAPQKSLVILEAPAGFGKTCTSYEISNILANIEDKRIPMLMELSKNRRASIFRYVLLAEIDAKFHLRYELVVEQIKEGKIPLIIDGFDELLSRYDTKETDNEEAITMLDTISELLSDNSQASILLTSRKSSIFAGIEFDKWLERKMVDCTVTRIQIMVPTIKDWLDKEKREYFSTKGIKLDNVQNPVLLSMLRNKPYEEFQDSFREESDILEAYIQLMFNRERERQLILLDTSEQREIMRKLSAVMVQLDVSTASSEEIKTMLETVVEKNIDNYLQRYRDYPDQDKVSNITEDAFLMKLANNAMLDRVKINRNDIGFINEFIFGIFVGEAITGGYLNVKDAVGVYLNSSISSFASEKKEEKNKLYDCICDAKLELPTEQKLMVGFNLKGSVIYDFVDEYIANVIFDKSISMDNNKFFYNCIFDTCTFTGCNINSELFEGCHFINCSFYNISIQQRNVVEEDSVFLSCIGHEELQKCLSRENKFEEAENTENEFRRKILEQYWVPGAEHAEMRKSYRTLFKGIDPKYRNQVAKTIKQLKDEDILTELIHCLELNKSKMDQIKEILGRK